MNPTTSAKNFEVPDAASVADALEIFKSTYGEGEFLQQQQVSTAIKILENPEYSTNWFGKEIFPGRVTLKRHDYLQAICNAPGTPAGEAFIIGLTMASTGQMNKFKSFLYLLFANIFFPPAFRYDTAARKIFYRTVEECSKLAKKGVLKNISTFPIENHTSDSVGSIRKMLGLDVVLSKSAYLYRGI